MRSLVFWQRMVSPHIAGLARALASQGSDVTFCAAEAMSDDRMRQGWTAPRIPGARVELVAPHGDAVALVSQYAPDAVHVVQGLRRNGYVARIIGALRARRARWGAMMETVSDAGLRGVAKRADYRFGLRWSKPDFVLAIGDRTPGWIAARGYSAFRTFPFAYFLDPVADTGGERAGRDDFKIGFVGNMTPGKRVDLLIAAAAGLDSPNLEVTFVGDGPLDSDLRRLAERSLHASRVRWLGRLAMAEAHQVIAGLDCLVLPSDHDGWGAVVSEAMMAGVPAICSDACGSAAAVRASLVGGVFPAGDVEALGRLLRQVVLAGPLNSSERARLKTWGRVLSGDAGARYLRAILSAVYDGQERPDVPWEAPILRQ